MIPPADTFGSVSALVSRIQEYRKGDDEHAHIRWLWRGQPDETWDLIPGVYRSSFGVNNESERLLKEQHLSQDFRVESAGLIEGLESDARLYFLQQHYGMPTSLLDWTNNALAALFFAAREQPEKDGAVFLMDGYELSPTQKAASEYQGIVTMRHPMFQKALRRIAWDENEKFPKAIMAIRPDVADRRIGLQRSCFTFHVPNRKALTQSENTSLLRFRIPKDAKGRIVADLVLLGIDEFSIYGDLEHLALRLKRAHGIRS